MGPAERILVLSVRTVARRLLTAMSVAGVALVLTNGLAEAACSTNGDYHVPAQSGCCDIGTELNTTLPTSWSVWYPTSTTDEAAWLINSSNRGNAIEGGYYSGYFPYDGSWTNGLVAYYTVNNGGCPCGRASGALTAGKNIWMYVTSGAQIWVDGWDFGLGYSVSNGINAGQGEVKQGNGCTWMGGGSGEKFSAYWTPDLVHWYQWGSHNDAGDSPYWITSQSGHQYTNGGY